HRVGHHRERGLLVHCRSFVPFRTGLVSDGRPDWSTVDRPYFLNSAAWSAPGSWADRYTSPGRPRSQVTGCGWPLTESSKTGALNWVSDGAVPLVALAMAHCTASRA